MKSIRQAQDKKKVKKKSKTTEEQKEFFLGGLVMNHKELIDFILKMNEWQNIFVQDMKFQKTYFHKGMKIKSILSQTV